MNRAQKSAWFGLVMSPLLLLLFVSRVFFKPISSQLFNLLLLSSAFIFFVLLFFNLQKKDKVNIDERDNRISRKALIAAFSSTAAILIGACVIPPLIAKPTTSIPIPLLPAVLYILFFVFIIAYTVAILVQYRWANRGKLS